MIVPKQQIKDNFETDDIPTEQQYDDFIDSSYNEHVNVLIPFADVRTIQSAPVELVAAPGPGFILVPFGSIVFSMIFQSQAYNFASSVSIIQFPSVATVMATPFNAGLNGGVSFISNTSLADAFSLFENEGIFLAGLDDANQGNSDLRVQFSYRIFEF